MISGLTSEEETKIPSTRKCIHCEHEKSIDDFYVRKDGKRNNVCRQCHVAKTLECRNRHEEPNRSRRLVYERYRLLVMTKLGSKCACCGETERGFLTLDHISGGGNEHKRSVGRGISFWRSVHNEGCPTDKYRILCYNCNCARGALGYCPHERS